MKNITLIAILNDAAAALVGMTESFRDRERESESDAHLSASEWIAVLSAANVVRDLWRELPDAIKEKAFDNDRYQGKDIGSTLYPHKYETDNNFMRAADLHRLTINVSIWIGKVYREARDALDLYSSDTDET